MKPNINSLIEKLQQLSSQYEAQLREIEGNDPTGEKRKKLLDQMEAQLREIEYDPPKDEKRKKLSNQSQKRLLEAESDASLGNNQAKTQNKSDHEISFSKAFKIIALPILLFGLLCVPAIFLAEHFGDLAEKMKLGVRDVFLEILKFIPWALIPMILAHRVMGFLLQLRIMHLYSTIIGSLALVTAVRNIFSEHWLIMLLTYVVISILFYGSHYTTIDLAKLFDCNAGKFHTHSSENSSVIEISCIFIYFLGMILFVYGYPNPFSGFLVVSALFCMLYFVDFIENPFSDWRF